MAGWTTKYKQSIGPGWYAPISEQRAFWEKYRDNRLADIALDIATGDKRSLRFDRTDLRKAVEALQRIDAIEAAGGADQWIENRIAQSKAVTA